MQKLLFLTYSFNFPFERNICWSSGYDFRLWRGKSKFESHKCPLFWTPRRNVREFESPNEFEFYFGQISDILFKKTEIITKCDP